MNGDRIEIDFPVINGKIVCREITHHPNNSVTVRNIPFIPKYHAEEEY